MSNISFDEERVRRELEMDVEKEMEEEIKEGICRLALRLQRLYQRQKEREARDEQGVYRNGPKIPSEVNINIKMEGGTKIEIKEISKQDRENRRLVRSPTNDQLAHVQRIMSSSASPGKNKFDWTKSLRSC